jgi:hypothetical protein
VTDDVYADFRDAVNMTPAELKKWLATDESKGVGQKSSAGAESVGHDSGNKIIAILGKKKAALTEADEAHMRKVVGYVHRHMAQRPHGDVSETPWRYSLMNWGHDPLKK